MTTARSDQRALCFNGVKDYNALPSHVEKAASYGQFKLRLKTELAIDKFYKEHFKLGYSF